MGKVIVVGLYGMSALFQVECLPREGETVLAGELVFEPGGKGYNQAVAAGRMGAEVFFATAVGRDFYGACAEQEMERDGIRRRQISTRERGTAFAAVFTDGRGDNSVVVHPGACTQLNRGWARELERDCPGRCVADSVGVSPRGGGGGVEDCKAPWYLHHLKPGSSL